jgi:phage terminase large subunit-like protein
MVRDDLWRVICPAGRSPDRADALVWAMTTLMLGGEGEARVMGF